MENTEYVFQISRYDRDRILPQLSTALKTRTELISREQYPRLWKQTDKLNAIGQKREPSRLRTRLLSVLCLAVGIFLFVPGVMKPLELPVPLLVGALAVGGGIGGLWRSRKHKKDPFVQAAQKLMDGLGSNSECQKTAVTLSAQGITLPDGELLPYKNFECAVEMPDALLFVCGERVILLQKSDLISGTVDEVCEMLARGIPRYTRTY